MCQSRRRSNHPPIQNQCFAHNLPIFNFCSSRWSGCLASGKALLRLSTMKAARISSGRGFRFVVLMGTTWASWNSPPVDDSPRPVASQDPSYICPCFSLCQCSVLRIWTFLHSDLGAKEDTRAIGKAGAGRLMTWRNLINRPASGAWASPPEMDIVDRFSSLEQSRLPDWGSCSTHLH